MRNTQRSTLTTHVPGFSKPWLSEPKHLPKRPVQEGQANA